jgi:signal peptidase I
MSEPFQKSTAREYFESIVIAVILALFVRTFVVQAFKIPSGSMEDNLLIGDHLLVNKFIYGPAPTALERALLPVREIRRGDVIVFKYPGGPDRDFIKRTIGLPGETLEVRDKVVYINGQPLDQAAYNLKFKPRTEDHRLPPWAIDFGPVTIPEGHLFMMGDNRDDSSDSRSDEWRFLPIAYVKGRAMTIYFSYDPNPENSGVASLLTSIRFGRLFKQVR